jgi:hypothetical protein
MIVLYVVVSASGKERKCSVLQGRMELPAHESMVGLSMTNRYRNATSGAKGTLNCEKSGADAYAHNVVPAKAGTHAEYLESGMQERHRASDVTNSVAQYGFPPAREVISGSAGKSFPAVPGMTGWRQPSPVGVPAPSNKRSRASTCPWSDASGNPSCEKSGADADAHNVVPAKAGTQVACVIATHANLGSRLRGNDVS